MNIFNNPNQLTQTVEFGGADMAMMASLVPPAIAARIAEKFVDANWSKIKNDEELMAQALERSVEIIATRVADRIELKLKEES